MLRLARAQLAPSCSKHFPSRRGIFTVQDDRNKTFRKLTVEQNSRMLPPRVCPFHSKISYYAGSYLPRYPAQFEILPESKTVFFPDSNMTLDLENYDRFFIATISRYFITILPFMRRNTKYTSLWVLDKSLIDVILPLERMEAYLKGGASGSFRNHLDTYFTNIAESRPSYKCAFIFQFIGESEYRKLSYDELQMLKLEKKKVHSEGVDALMHKLRKPQQLLMTYSNYFITRRHNKLKDTKYTNAVNRLYAQAGDRMIMPSEFTISDQRQENYEKKATTNIGLHHRGSSSSNINAVSKQLEHNLNDTYYNNISTILEAVSSDYGMDFFKTKLPCSLASKINREMSLVHYNVNYPDAVVPFFKKYSMNLQIAHAIELDTVLTSTGYLDRPTQLYKSSYGLQENLTDALFFSYIMIDGCEANKPYRSFPNVYYNEEDVMEWLSMNFRIDNNINFDVPMTYRVYGGTFYHKNFGVARKIIRSAMPYWSKMHGVKDLGIGVPGTIKSPTRETDSLPRLPAIQDLKKRFSRKFNVSKTGVGNSTVSCFVFQMHLLFNRFKMEKDTSAVFFSLWGPTDDEIVVLRTIVKEMEWLYDFPGAFQLYTKKLDERTPKLEGKFQDHHNIAYIIPTTNVIKAAFPVQNDPQLYSRNYLESFEKQLIDQTAEPEEVFIMPTSDTPCVACSDFVSYRYVPKKRQQLGVEDTIREEDDKVFMKNLVVDEDDFSALIEDDFEFSAEKLENYDVLNEPALMHPEDVDDASGNVFDDSLFGGEAVAGCKNELDGDDKSDFALDEFGFEPAQAEFSEMDDLFDMGDDTDAEEIDFENILADEDSNEFHANLDKFKWKTVDSAVTESRHYK